ncbi:MAG TPA: ABC transporter substrate-binding protein [Chloroflexota bacterium]|nr:ABC transporter substrate-binding protein [Chloroflexota bacterium]
MITTRRTPAMFFAFALFLGGCGGSAAVSPTPSSPAAASAKPAASTAASVAGKPAVSDSAAAAAASGGVSVKVAVQGRPDQAALQLAIDRGYLAKQGLNISTVQIDSGAQMVPALATNQIQVGNGAPSAALFNALNRSVDIRMVADYAHVGPPTDTTLALLVRKELMDSGTVKSVADLKGRNVGLGTVKGTVSDYLFSKALDKAKATDANINVQYMPFPDIVSALGTGKLDAGTLTEPLVTQVVQQNIAKVLHPSGEVIPGAHLSVLQYSPEFASSQASAATRFMVGYLQGVRDYYDAFFQKKDRDAAIKLLTQSLSVKDAHIWEIAQPESIDLNGKVNLDDLKAQAQFYSQQGTLQGGVPDIAKYIDSKFADAAVKELGPR